MRGAAGGLALGLAIWGLRRPRTPRRGTSGATFGPTRPAPALARSLAPAATCRSSTRVAYGDTVDVDSLGHYNPSDTNTVISTRNRISPGGTYGGAFPPDRIVYRGADRCAGAGQVEGGLPEFRGSRPRASGSRARPGSATLGSRPATTTAWRLTPALIRGGSGFTGSKGSIVKNSTIAGNLWINTSTGSPVRGVARLHDAARHDAQQHDRALHRCRDRHHRHVEQGHRDYEPVPISGSSATAFGHVQQRHRVGRQQLHDVRLQLGRLTFRDNR